MILKAQDSLDTAKTRLDDPSQHDIVGYNLAQAAECMLKALCSLRGIEYPNGDDGHDLDVLVSLLEEDNMQAISSHADIIELTPYNQTRQSVRQDERLNLKEYFGYVEDLKKLVVDVS